MTAVEDEEEDINPVEWKWARLGALGLKFVGNLFDSVTTFCGEIDKAVAAHLLYQDKQREFAASVERDIEQIAAGHLV